LKYIIIAIAAVLLFIIIELIREFFCFRVTHYRISPDEAENAGKTHRILFLSDMHNRVYGKENCRLLRAVQEEEPELILIGGDMLIGKSEYSFLPALHFVKSLAKICPVYYANGNHEQRMKENPMEYLYSYRQYRKELAEAGVHFLENESQKIQLGEMLFYIAGVEVPMECYSHFHRKNLKMEELIKRIGVCPEEGYPVLLAHNPADMETYFAWGAKLILSGHFHGGIVRIPGIGGVISTGFHLFPKYSGGIYHNGKQTAVVSKGLGSHTIPVRLFNPAEVVVLDISET